jgi:hypothetical protein
MRWLVAATRTGLSRGFAVDADAVGQAGANVTRRC